MKKLLFIPSLFLFFSLSLSAQCFETLATDGWHTVGQKPDGTLWGWGNSEAGQLLATDEWEHPTPIQLETDIAVDVDKIYIGGHSTFVIKNDSTLWGTGHNLYGCLGVNSSAEEIHSFQQITTATNWVKISASAYYTLGLKSDGTIWGWGHNLSYELGNSPASVAQLSPIQIGTDTDWVDVVAGTSSTSFALKSDGTIWGWGFNPTSIIVQGSSTHTVPTPTQVGTGTDWLSMSVGSSHILAQKTDSTLWSWGGGAGLGVGGTPAVTNTPQQISTDKWKCFSAGGNISFGIKEDGTLWSWGVNSFGRLGVGDSLDRLVPTQIGTDNNWRTISGGTGAVMGTKTDGTVWYWGMNNYGQFGNGTIEHNYLEVFHNTPVQTQGICIAPICDGINVNITLDAGTLTAAATGLTYQWIDCATHTPIDGATGVSFTPTTEGSYAVIITEGFCSDTSACMSSGPVYTPSTIGAATDIAANGVGTAVGNAVTLTGVVHCQNFSNTGYDITLIDANNDGINLFSATNVNDYSPTEGDKIQVNGLITQVNGLLQLKPDHISVLQQGAALQTPTLTTVLNDSTESQLVKIDSLELVNGETTWPTNGNILVTNRVDTFTVRITAASTLAGTAAPVIPFHLTGIGRQHDSFSPFDADYQIYPCGINPYCDIDNSTSTHNGTITASATGLTYQWINCADNAAIAGATGASFTPTTNGNYAVMITQGPCVDTSACVLIETVSIEEHDAAAASFVISPNPAKDVASVKYALSSSHASLEVYDVLGKTVAQHHLTSAKGEFSLNISKYIAGTYILVLRQSNGQTLQQKLVVK